MTPSFLYHTQGICGYKYQKTERVANTEVYYLHSKVIRLPCPACLSRETYLVQMGKTRDIRDRCIGKKTIMRVNTHRIVCRDCGASTQEPIGFCSDVYVRHTQWAVARFVLALRSEMSIKATARFAGMHWKTVKNIEKA